MNIWEELTISVLKPQFYRSWLFIDTNVCLWCKQRVAHWDKCLRAWCSGGDGTGTVGKAWKMTLTCGRAALPVCRSTDWTVQHVVDAWTLPRHCKDTTTTTLHHDKNSRQKIRMSLQISLVYYCPHGSYTRLYLPYTRPYLPNTLRELFVYFLFLFSMIYFGK